MNILLATLYSYPQKGGLGSYIKVLAGELEQAGHSVDILACHPSFTGYYLVRGNQLVRTLEVREGLYGAHPELEPEAALLDPWVRNRELERHTFQRAAARFQLTQYDVIHTQDVISTVALASLKNEKTRLIQTIHGSLTYDLFMAEGKGIERTEAWRYAALSEREGVEASTYTVTPSKWLQDIIVENSHAARERMRVIPNGIAVQEFAPFFQRRLHQPGTSRKQVITCVGHLSDLKGQQYLLESLALLKQQQTDWVCWLVGDGPKKAEFEQLANRLGLLEDEVVFLGPRDDIAYILSRTDVFVLPSLTENCPYAVLEAQVAGVPVIASDVGGVPEVINHGVTGFLTPAANPLALYHILAQVLEDKSLQQFVRQNCERRCRLQWSVENMVKALEKLYWPASKGGSVL